MAEKTLNNKHKSLWSTKQKYTSPQCCGSGMFKKREGWKKIWCHTFLCSHKFHKIVHYFSFEVLKKKIWANFQRIIEFFAQKIVTKLSKVWVWDPGSEIRDPEKTYSGSRGQKGAGSRIRIRNTASPKIFWLSTSNAVMFYLLKCLYANT